MPKAGKGNADPHEQGKGEGKSNMIAKYGVLHKDASMLEVECDGKFEADTKVSWLCADGKTTKSVTVGSTNDPDKSRGFIVEETTTR